jgi:cellulose synthase/poly-beta-1,6-N-acetylglucosamine synthase-like glycosyltransferase
MIAVLGYIVFGIYCTALLYITIFCLVQFQLLWQYKRKEVTDILMLDDAFDDLPPFVTVQLPIYNEQYVVVRLIDNICRLNYPKDRFEIQILDDSDDETLDISRQKVAEYKKKGFNIELVTRKKRTGYKAGALQNGLKTARGEFIAIFDADFLPKPEFLIATIQYFQDPKIGVVQTKWEHINQNYSLITRLQAFQLNVHFTVEQSGRQAADYLLQFNGTAGVWRKQTIEDAGGWEADTLTEDLDLSIRAQLKGWTIRYLEDVGSPAELPAEMNSLKSQQFRWMKGGAETAKKMLPTVWKSSLSYKKKLHATIHLLSSTIFVFVFLVGVFSVPLLFVLGPLGINANYFTFFLIGLLTIAAVYYVANVQASWVGESKSRTFFKFVVMFPLFLSLSMGLSLHNSIAVLQGYMGKKSPFIRTPKFNIQGITDTFSKSKYLPKKIPFTTFLEGFLAIYFMGAIIAAIYYNDTTFIIFHLLLTFGYGAICYYSIRHLRFKNS